MRDTYFNYENKKLYVEDLMVENIVKETGTPTYIYSRTCIEDRITRLKNALQDIPSIVCYAMKSCNNNNILKVLTNQDVGFDIVSGGELYRALKVGADPKKIVYSGVGKTKKEIAEAITAGILMINVESLAELDRINDIAYSMSKVVNVAIRVNPGVDAKTHPYITTGLRENKFGIDKEHIKEVFTYAASLPNVDVVGIDCHIGSQLLDIDPYKDAMEIVASYVEDLRNMGIYIQYVDVGGGVGIPYKENDDEVCIEDYVAAVTAPFEKWNDIVFIFEPGRWLIGKAGILVTEVQYTKVNSFDKKFVIVDTGMNHMMRPALYNGYHRIQPVEKRDCDIEKVDIVGPICESSDFLAKGREMEKLCQGDLIAVMDVGAYGIVLASHYNLHAIPVEVLVKDNEYKVIRKRETYEDIMRNEVWD